ncbi:transglycosylase SLT domain-containing protein [Pseudovibrio sp. Ad37]|uniref:transglycosylase SLT domain-containing protein n=1 Tax=Pseudovibrio sp. Ad37 TaxID=989422 RepID=UPI0012903C86|nr:transglycosylase SLT domain-containing protein [Pseudovibrio sp. Ad37]
MRYWIYVTFLFVLLSTSPSAAVDLHDTIFSKVGEEQRIDPFLLYSVALAESAKSVGKGNIAPSIWALRAPSGAVYPFTLELALSELDRLTKAHGKMVDVGLMQVNLRWHGHRVQHPSELLDPVVNIEVGAQILVEAILSAPDDIELGIGRYHTWADENRARNYGQRVLAIWRNIKGE